MCSQSHLFIVHQAQLAKRDTWLWERECGKRGKSPIPGLRLVAWVNRLVGVKRETAPHTYTYIFSYPNDSFTTLFYLRTREILTFKILFVWEKKTKGLLRNNQLRDFPWRSEIIDLLLSLLSGTGYFRVTTSVPMTGRNTLIKCFHLNIYRDKKEI